MRPDDPEVRKWIGASLVAQVATLSRKEAPALTPLWFVCDRGHLYMGTGRATLAARNIAVYPRVVLLFCAEQHGKQNRVLRITGTATCHHNVPPWRVIVRFAMKYYLNPRALRSELSHRRKWRLRQRYYAQTQAATIEVVPENAEFVPRVA
jgi:nitroimidazol reductase NimA-like FMN-containing flavoprotein (pyridoxamine 5'-phosphate oxidase superfamily)